MTPDFDTPINRRDTNSYKWDSSEDEKMIPLWVADMDFRTAPAIIEALKRRVNHGVFGYTRVPDEYYDATIQWFATQHGLEIERDWIIYTSGVVPAISAVIKALAPAGSKVIVQTPVYNCFFSSIRNNGCEILESPLIYNNQTYTMDFADLEEKAAKPESKLLLLCNPHNPAGRVWSEAELRRLGEICMANGVTVVSDEIHCELVFPPHRYTPYASLGKEFMAKSVTCCSPSKAFNIAGLQIANIFTADDSMRRRIDRAININEVCDVNPFGVEALIAAYRHGQPWLEALTGYLWGNYQALLEFFKENLPELPVTRLEGTYLVWVDCRSLGISSDRLEETLCKKEHVWLNSGTMYGRDGEGFMRINIACPRQRLIEGLSRFSRGVRDIAANQ